MKPFIWSLFYLSLLLSNFPAHAETKIAGVVLPDTYIFDNRTLVLNGAGIRSKFFVKVYVGALYLEETVKDSNIILASQGGKSMQMTMLYKKVEAEKITNGWTDGFRSNLSGEEFSRLNDRLEAFNALFPDLQAGDTVRMNYSPGIGTRLAVNGELLGVVKGEDFVTALLKVWIGKNPADEALKQGLLGQ